MYIYICIHSIKNCFPSYHLAFRNSMAEEKRRIENRLSTLEEDLEEEQMNSEAAVDKARKAEQQLDALNTEISQLQGNLQKSENAKSQFEKQVCVCACMLACACMHTLNVYMVVV